MANPFITDESKLDEGIIGGTRTGIYVTAYLPGYRRQCTAANIDWSCLTHLCYFNAYISGARDGSYVTGPLYTGNSLDPHIAASLIVAAHAAGKKVLLTLGASDGSFPVVMTNHRTTLLANTLALLDYGKVDGNTEQFDGFDLDIESYGSQIQGHEALYYDFVSYLKAHLSANQVLICAVGCSDTEAATAHAADISILNGAPGDNFAQINLMNYAGMTGAWQGWEVWHNAPTTSRDANGNLRHLYNAPDSVLPSAEYWADRYVAAGIPAYKIGISAEFAGQVWYGNGTTSGLVYAVGHNGAGGYRGVELPNDDWGGGTGTGKTPLMQPDVPFSEDYNPSIMGTYYPAGTYVYDSLAKVPYISIQSATASACKFITYDDETSIADKIALINNKGYGGLMLWELGIGWRSTHTPKDQLLQAAGLALATAGTLDHFSIATIPSQTVNQVFDIVITARDVLGAVITGYVGTCDLSTTAGAISPTVTTAFVAGVCTQAVQVSGTGTGRTITVTNTGSTETGTSNTFDVSPLTLNHFDVSTIASQLTGTPFTVTITAKDVSGNVVPSFAGTVTLTSSDTDINGSVSPNALLGVAVISLSCSTAGAKSFVATRTGGAQTGTSNTFVVSPNIPYSSTISTPSSPQVAGTPFIVMVTLYDQWGNVCSNYSTSGGMNACNLYVSAGNITIISGGFINGTAMMFCSVSPAGTGLTMTASTGILAFSPPSGTFDVIAAPLVLDHFDIATIGTQQSMIAFDVVITAKTDNGVTITDYSDQVTISGDITSDVISSNFFSGVLTVSVRCLDTGGGKHITATAGTVTKTSNAFTVTAGVYTYLVITGTITNIIAGIPFNITVTAKDTMGNTDFTAFDTVTLTPIKSTITINSGATLNYGVTTMNVTITDACTAEFIVASAAGRSSPMWGPFDVVVYYTPPTQIASLTDVKLHLGIALTDTSHDLILQSWINETSNWIEQYCNSKFALTDIIDEILDGDGTQFIYSRWNIYGFYSADWSDDFLYVPDPTVTVWEKIATDKNDILFDPKDPQRFRLWSTCLPLGWNNVKISYKAGYSPIPSDVVMTLIDMIQMRWNESKQGNDTLGKSSSAISSGANLNISYKDMKPEWYEVLSKYRRVML
jgi:chitinase